MVFLFGRFDSFENRAKIVIRITADRLLVALALSGYFNLLFLFFDFVEPVEALGQLDLALGHTLRVDLDVVVLGDCVLEPAALPPGEDLRHRAPEHGLRVLQGLLRPDQLEASSVEPLVDGLFGSETQVHVVGRLDDPVALAQFEFGHVVEILRLGECFQNSLIVLVLQDVLFAVVEELDCIFNEAAVTGSHLCPVVLRMGILNKIRAVVERSCSNVAAIAFDVLSHLFVLVPVFSVLGE